MRKPRLIIAFRNPKGEREEENHMKNVTTFITVGILYLAISTALSSPALAQAIKPLSGTKGADAVNTGVHQFNQGNLDNAMSQFQQALKQNPRSGVAHYNLALTYSRLGRPDLAAKHFQQASEFGRGNPFIQNSSVLKQHTQSQTKK
jgi:Tfp pilus assembly protein PilF